MSMLPMVSGLFGRGVTPSYAPQDQPQPMMQQPKLGTFDKIGLAGDILTGRNVTGQRLEQQWEPFQRAAQMQQQQAAQWAMWERQKQWELANRPPQEPNALERNYEFIKRTAPGTEATYIDNFARNGGSMPQLMNVPGVGVVSIPKTAAPQAPAYNGALDSMPAVEDGYRYTPGPGGRGNQNNWKAVGGAAPQGAGTFQP